MSEQIMRLSPCVTSPPLSHVLALPLVVLLTIILTPATNSLRILVSYAVSYGLREVRCKVMGRTRAMLRTATLAFTHQKKIKNYRSGATRMRLQRIREMGEGLTHNMGVARFLAPGLALDCRAIWFHRPPLPHVRMQHDEDCHTYL